MPVSSVEANRVISVTLEPDEEVEWTWTYWPSGETTITGYTIIKKGGSAPEKTSAGRRFQKKRKMKRALRLGSFIGR